MDPQVDQRIDVVGEGIDGRYVENLMQEHVRLQRSHEKESCRTRVPNAHHARALGSPEVFGHDLQPASRRGVGIARIERQDDRRLRPRVHVDREILGERLLHERHELLGHAAKHDARVRRGIDIRELENELGHRDPMRTHRVREQLLLAWKVAKDGCCRDVQLRGDVGERRRLETLRREYLSRGLEQFLASDERWPAHL